MAWKEISLISVCAAFSKSNYAWCQIYSSQNKLLCDGVAEYDFSFWKGKKRKTALLIFQQLPKAKQLVTFKNHNELHHEAYLKNLQKN